MDERNIQAQVNEGREASETEQISEIEQPASTMHIEEEADSSDVNPRATEEPYIRDAERDEPDDEEEND